MAKGIVFDIKEFTVHDGPGIRTTVFLKGCPLRCLWCHNPEGMDVKPQLMIPQNGCLHCGKCMRPCSHPECAPFSRCTKICPKGLVKIAGTEMDSEPFVAQLREQAMFFEDGGVTISGGEPTMQPTFLFALLDGLAGIHTVVETCGYTTPEIFQTVVEKAGTVYLDIKHMDSTVHKKLTGVLNERIQANLSYLIGQEKPFLVRMPLIPGLNDDAENLSALARRLSGAKALQRVEFLPYNPFTGAKYAMAEMPFQLAEIDGHSYKPSSPKEAFAAAGVPFAVL